MKKLLLLLIIPILSFGQSVFEKIYIEYGQQVAYDVE
jgi:hypothetical protein